MMDNLERRTPVSRADLVTIVQGIIPEIVSTMLPKCKLYWVTNRDGIFELPDLIEYHCGRHGLQVAERVCGEWGTGLRRSDVEAEWVRIMGSGPEVAIIILAPLQPVGDPWGIMVRESWEGPKGEELGVLTLEMYAVAIINQKS